MRRARYICFEGTEGVGKTTQVQKLVEYLRDKGYSVLHTKEPGTPLAPLTMALRGIMLDSKYDDELTTPARELISQAIRSIHMEKVVSPALKEYDYVVQDRGVLSGIAYGSTCGNDVEWLLSLMRQVTPAEDLYQNGKIIYDDVVYLKGNVANGLKKALQSKQEFEAGDSIEKRGDSFMEQVSASMQKHLGAFNASVVTVDGRTIEEVHSDIVAALGLEK